MKTTNTDLREVEKFGGHLKVEPTDLREAFTLYDLRGGWANTHDKEIILRQINKKVRKDYILKSEAISRKDAVSKSEVEKAIKKMNKKKNETDNFNNCVTYGRCERELVNLLTEGHSPEVDKPAKE